MTRSSLLRQALAAFHKASWLNEAGLPTHEGLQRLNEDKPSRRQILKGGAVAAGSLLAAPLMGARNRPQPRIAIVGGGLSGLVCADSLRAKGYSATIYEAGNRLGGRCYSLRGLFPGQVAEYGGEFIDTGHRTMLSYANEFRLEREDVEKAPGETAFHIGGQRYTEEQVVDEYRLLAPRMRSDLQTSSGAPTFASHTPGDVALDYLTLEEYLATRAADLPIVRTVLDIAYVAEYGRETAEQSSLNMLLFLHADRAAKFRPFGVFSDERFHLVGGNDAIASGIASRLPGPIHMGMQLTRVSKNALGEYVLRFANGSTVRADAVVLAIPFSVLRNVELDPSLNLSADKQRAIRDLGYGHNAKTMLGFHGRPWANSGGSGECYSDLPNIQNTWETNGARAGARSILTDYAGGERGRTLAQGSLNARVGSFLDSLDVVFPGAKSAYTGQAARLHWPTEPLFRGSYTCYLPGQFTGLAGLEAEAAGALKFAGEHTDSFYSWQGFMEGACLAGLRAASEVLADIKAGSI